MSKIKGTVSKAGKGKFSYFVLLDGNDFYYNTKFEPKCGEGDVVGIEFTPKGESRGQISKCVVLEDNSGGYAKANSETSGGAGSSGSGSRSSNSGSGSNRGSGGDRNASIVCQHSQEMAIRTSEIILANEAFAVKGKADARFTQIVALIDTLTVKFYNDALDPEAAEFIKIAREIEKDSKSSDDGGDWDGDEEEKSEGDNWDEWD